VRPLRLRQRLERFYRQKVAVLSDSPPVAAHHLLSSAAAHSVRGCDCAATLPLGCVAGRTLNLAAPAPQKYKMVPGERSFQSTITLPRSDRHIGWSRLPKQGSVVSSQLMMSWHRQSYETRAKLRDARSCALPRPAAGNTTRRIEASDGLFHRCERHEADGRC
jgi:hypothetical protein